MEAILAPPMALMTEPPITTLHHNALALTVVAFLDSLCLRQVAEICWVPVLLLVS